jgi:hypothetical protein
MRLVSILLFVAGLILLGLGVALTFLLGLTTMPSYLANWLFWSSLPLGALPVVMLLDLAGPGSGFGLEPVLRRMLLLMPLAALLMIPVLVRPAELFGWAMGHGFSAPLGKAWMNHGAFVARSIVYFVIWIVLALLFLAPPSLETVERRRGLAAVGLLIYALSITLASVDWAMTTEPNWYSPEYGLLFASAQATIALCFAVLVSGGWRRAFPEPAAAFILVGAVGWVFMQFIQYLVIWSADKPSDIVFYLHRWNLGSRVVVWIAFLGALVVPLFLLLSPIFRRRAYVLPAMALLVLCVQALDMLWLVTPSLRHTFIVSGMDALELFGIGGVIVGICLWPGMLPRHAVKEPQHG